MRDVKSTPQHKTDNFADGLFNSFVDARQMLLGSSRKKCVAWVLSFESWLHVFPAGGALAVDRDGFLPNGD